MQSNSTQSSDSHPAQMVAEWIVSTVKVLATALLKLLGWVVTWIYKAVIWVLRRVYNWFKGLNGTAKILFLLNVVLAIAVIVLWLDLDLWSVFYGNQ